MNEIKEYTNKIFEDIKHIDENGNEYWYARELMEVLEYSLWQRFSNVLKKAMENCKNSNSNVLDHFISADKMVSIGSNTTRNITDYKLSRYACYLIVLNCDPRKKVIALAKTYFAVQTRKQELSEKEYSELTEDEKRLYRRNQARKGNFNLNQTAVNSGVKDLARFHNAGYKGLYNGETAADIFKRKKLRYREDILDNMGSEELADNIFRIAQTDAKLKRDNIDNEYTANSIHYEVGKEVRNSIKRLGGTMPEDLPTPNKSLKELEKENKKLGFHDIIKTECENMDLNDVINYLNSSNKETVKTLINGFVNDITVKYLPLYVFETFALNKEAQEIIMQLPEQHLKNISKIINYSEGINQDWIPLCANYYHFLTNKRYTNLINGLNSYELNQAQIEKLLFVINNGGNYFDINSIDDLNNLSTIRNDKNDKNETRDPNILLLNKYGISYDKAYNLYTRYGKDVEHLPESQEKDFLLDIKNIIEGKGTEKNVFDNLSFIINIDSILRNFYSKIYDDCFYHPTEDKKIGNIEDVEIYDAGVDFNMCVYSYGMATEYSTPENFKADWNRPSISTDYMCNSIINSCSIKTHVKHCLFGFRNFGRNNLSLLGSNDLGTGGLYRELNVTNPFHQKKLIADVEFRTPDSLINNTRFTNNEVYRSRRRIANGKLERINPDYIVYLKTKENYSEDPIWFESLKAAKDFGIPIVIVDCDKCLLGNVEKIEQNMELFEGRFDDSKLLTSIIELIYTINSGYRDIAPELLEKHFNKDKVVSYLERIITHIDEISTNSPITSLECINIVLNILNNEFEKVLKSPYWVDYARKQGYTVEKPIDVIKVFENKKIELENLVGYQDSIAKAVN